MFCNLLCNVVSLALAVSCVYYLLCSLQQGKAEHTTNLCHYSVIASNHMISFMGQWRRPAWCGWLLQSPGNGPVALWWRVVCCPPCRAKDAPSFSLPEMASGWIVFFTAQPFHLLYAWVQHCSFHLENIAYWYQFFSWTGYQNMGSESFGNRRYCESFV